RQFFSPRSPRETVDFPLTAPGPGREALGPPGDWPISGFIMLRGPSLQFSLPEGRDILEKWPLRSSAPFGTAHRDVCSVSHSERRDCNSALRVTVQQVAEPLRRSCTKVADRRNLRQALRKRGSSH